MLVSYLTEEQKSTLFEWRGRYSDGVTQLRRNDLNAQHLLREVLPYAEAYLQPSNFAVSQDEFITPPRPGVADIAEAEPTTASTDLNSETQGAIAAAQEALSQYEQEELDEETIHTIASVFDVDPGSLRPPKLANMRAAVPETSKTPEVKDMLGTPPGLETPSATSDQGVN